MSETALSRSIQSGLEAVGFKVIRVQSGMLKLGNRYIHCAPKGTPDLYVLGAGWLEVKAEGGVIRPDQRRWHEYARSIGERVEVVRSVKEAIETCRGWLWSKT